MANPSSIRRNLNRVGLVFLVLVAVPAGCFVLDSISISKAKPPESVRTIEDLKAWKKGEIRGRGIFVHGGVAYTVMLGRGARSMASGPSAYLFDTNGEFVDWTADMGDFYTVKYHFNLTGGNVVNIERQEP